MQARAVRGKKEKDILTICRIPRDTCLRVIQWQMDNSNETTLVY